MPTTHRPNPYRTLQVDGPKTNMFIGVRPNDGPVYVIGHMFGPCILCVGMDLSDAFDEWDEWDTSRHIGPDEDFDDWSGNTIEERFERALEDGEIRINDGGTVVWVDHYEWVREFPTVREAGRFFREA